MAGLLPKKHSDEIANVLRTTNNMSRQAHQELVSRLVHVLFPQETNLEIETRLKRGTSNSATVANINHFLEIAHQFTFEEMSRRYGY